MGNSSCQGHQEILFVNEEQRGRAIKEHGVWIFVGISIYNLFSPTGVMASGLYHTVARSLATKKPSKSASDYLFKATEPEPLGRAHLVACGFGCDCHTQCTASAWKDGRRHIASSQTGKRTNHTGTSLRSLSIAIQKPRACKRVSMGKDEIPPEKQTPYTRFASQIPSRYCRAVASRFMFDWM